MPQQARESLQEKENRFNSHPENNSMPQNVDAIIEENQRLKQQLEQLKNQQEIQGVISRCESEREEFARLYPNVDLKAELDNKDFARALFAGLSFRTAFEATHKEDILSNLIAYTIEKTTEKVMEEFKSKANRPTENGASKIATVNTKAGVKNLSKKEREDIEKRVLMGERVTF